MNCQYLVDHWSYVIIMSRTSFRVNLRSIVYLNVMELLAWNRRNIWSLNGSKGFRTQNHLVRKRTLNHLAKLAVSELSCCGFDSCCCHLNFSWSIFNKFSKSSKKLTRIKFSRSNWTSPFHKYLLYKHIKII